MNAQVALQTIQLLGCGSGRVEKACEKLDMFLWKRNIVDIYREICPADYLMEQGGIDERLLSFYRKLSEKLPICDIDWLEESRREDDNPEWFPRCIPFYSITPYETDCVDEWRSLSAKVIHEIWWISGCGGEAEAWESLEKKTKLNIPKPKKLNTLNLEKVEEAIKSIKGGMQFLQAFKVVSHDADNFFTDNDDEMMCNTEVTWSTEEIRGALQQIESATEMFKQTEETCARYDANYPRFAKLLKQVVEIWNSGGGDAG